VLAALRGRTVALVGDSTSQQLWTALMAELFAAEFKIDVVHRVLEFDIRPGNHNIDGMCTVSHSNPPKSGGSEQHFRLDARAARTCNLTRYAGGAATNPLWPIRPMCHSIPDVELEMPEADVRFRFYRIDRNGSKNIKALFQRTHAHCNTPERNFDAKIEAAMSTSDAVMANIGVWYEEAEAAAYRSDVRHIISRLKTLASSGKLGLYRQSIAQHFPTTTGSG